MQPRLSRSGLSPRTTGDLPRADPFLFFPTFFPGTVEEPLLLSVLIG